MPADQVISLIQLCVRTGRFAKGDGLLPAIQNQKAKLVVMSAECGANRAKKIKDKCAYYHIPLLVLPALRFNSVSSKVNAAVALLDSGFATKILQLAKLHNEDLIESKS